MNKVRILIVMILLTGGLFFNSKLSVSIPERIVKSTVFVEVVSKQGNKWSGSGVIISEDGLIMTAGHVTSEALLVRVTLYDGSFYDSVNFCSNNYPEADVGFIKIDAENLPTLKISNDKLSYGDIVYICGCPFGYDLRFTLTKGIIAGFDREISELGSKNLLQVDAQSWFGNSGGPVCNEKGEIVGILIGGMQGCDGLSLCTTADVAIIALDKYYLDLMFEGLE